MRSTRRRLKSPKPVVALALFLVVSVGLLVAPGAGSLAPGSSAQPTTFQGTENGGNAAAIEGWVSSTGAQVPLSGATVSLAPGASTTTDSLGHFSFSREQVASSVSNAGSQVALVDVSVQADGFSAWTMQSARYYQGDTLRLYAHLETSGNPAQVLVAGAPRAGTPAALGAAAQGLQQSINPRANDMETAAQAGTGVVPASLLGAQPGILRGVSAVAAYSDWAPPDNIRVYRTGTSTVEVVPFREYVKHVLPNEWVPTWAPASLRAGAMAVKEYAWYWISVGGKQAALGADVKDNTDDQVYDPNVSYASTDAAVDATWAYVLLRNNELFQAQYCAGSYGADPSADCPWANEYMTQWGTAYYADQGQSWTWICRFYYPDTAIAPGSPNDGEPLPPVPPSLPTPRPAQIAIGQGSTQPDVFVEAYDRNGGEAVLGRPVSEVHWWLAYVTDANVVAQRFSGADGQGNMWLVFDTLKSQVSGISRAFLLAGNIGAEYAAHDPAGPEWAGAPTSDPYVTAGGTPSQGFSKGILQESNGSVVFTPWPSQFSGWEARYYIGAQPQSLTGPLLDLPGQPALVMDQPSPALDWPAGSGAPQSMGLGSSAWSAQFTRQLQPDAGSYDLTVSADGGVRVWIDNLLAINKWDATSAHTEQYNTDLDGYSHTVRIQYMSASGAGKLDFILAKRDAGSGGAPPQAKAPDVPPVAPSGTGASGNASLKVSVQWLGHANPPSEQWVQPLTLQLSAPGNPAVIGSYPGTTDPNGVAVYSGLPEGTYDVHVKGLHSLQSARANINLSAAQSAEVDMKAQVEGDVDGDNCVTVDDFKVVQSMVGANKDTPGWNPTADLNNDGRVTAEDVSLLRSGFDKCGDISADVQFHTDSSEGAPTFEQQLSPWMNPAGLDHGLALDLQTSTPSVKVGDIVVLSVMADTGGQAVDGGAFNLKYDPAWLTPVDRNGNAATASEPGVALPAVLGNWIDPQGGSIGYSTSMLQGTPPQGRFTLATIRFRALQAGSTELDFAPLASGQLQLTDGGANLLSKTSNLSLVVAP